MHSKKSPSQTGPTRTDHSAEAARRAVVRLRKAGLWSVGRSLQRHWAAIQRAAQLHAVDPELLMGILVLETANRGLAFRVLERLVARVNPRYLVRRDCSIGIAQIRPSTARSVVDADSQRLVCMLLDDDGSIDVCARLIRRFSQEHHLERLSIRLRVAAVARLYTTGKLAPARHPWIGLYTLLLTYAVSNRLFHSLRGPTPV